MCEAIKARLAALKQKRSPGASLLPKAEVKERNAYDPPPAPDSDQDDGGDSQDDDDDGDAGYDAPIAPGGWNGLLENEEEDEEEDAAPPPPPVEDNIPEVLARKKTITVPAQAEPSRISPLQPNTLVALASTMTAPPPV